LLLLAVQNGQLIVQGPEIINVSDEEKTSGEEVEDSREPFAHVKPVNSENAKKGEQNPCHIIIVPSRSETKVGLTIHGWNEKEINDPTDEKQAQSEKIDGSGYRLAVIKPVGTSETEDPKNVADHLSVRVAFNVSHLLSSQCS
jgi:hypothetical protein